MLIIKTYSFRINKGDEGIDVILSSMSPAKRSQYMKDAILFYAGIGGELKELNSRIKQLLDGNFVSMDAKNTKGADIKETVNNDISEDILLASMEDLLDL